MFELAITATDGKARRGLLTTPHGTVHTPVFMPVGTAGCVKAVTPRQLGHIGVQMVLGNTYHLMLRPGVETVSALGGLHRLMAWDAPLLTDSGGYQVFSLAHLRSVDDDGVSFRSHIDGSPVRLDPESAVAIQLALAPDVMMQLDECPPAGAGRDQVETATRRSAAWARRCRDAWLAHGEAGRHALFGIQQGGLHADLRDWSAAQLVALDLPGYAVGGLSVGEGPAAMADVLARVDNQFPADRPRYLMGVGEPRDILAAVAAGIDMFDCVLPTRNARNAQAFTWTGRLRLRNAQWRQDTRPIEEACDCYTCRHFARGTIRHLFMAGEILAATLVTIHNLHFYMQFMSALRRAITEKNLKAMSQQWLTAIYPP